jgi:FtsP/CotA-like multicopper oxidase with cupredoxin domain
MKALPEKWNRMRPDDPGTWMFHCHIGDHMHGGMATLYQVTP